MRTRVYIGKDYTHREHALCGYSIMIIRSTDRETIYADIIYGVVVEPEYTELRDLGSEVFALIQAFRILNGALEDSYITNELLIYHSSGKLTEYLDPKLHARKPMLRFFQKKLEYYSTIFDMDFYHIDEKEKNFLSGVANAYAKAAGSVYSSNGNQASMIRNLPIPKSNAVL